MNRTSKLKVFINNLKSGLLNANSTRNLETTKIRRSYRFKEKKYSLISKFGPANLA
jgi:hypothetical protein